MSHQFLIILIRPYKEGRAYFEIGIYSSVFMEMGFNWAEEGGFR